MFHAVWLHRPLHLFGGLGAAAALPGMSIGLWLAGLRWATGSIQGHHTLLLTAVAMIVMGGQFFATGLLGELLIRVLIAERDGPADGAAEAGAAPASGGNRP